MEPSLLLQQNSKCKTFLLYTVSVDAPKVFEKDAERLLWLASPGSSNRNDTSNGAKPQRLEENDSINLISNVVRKTWILGHSYSNPFLVEGKWTFLNNRTRIAIERISSDLSWQPTARSTTNQEEKNWYQQLKQNNKHTQKLSTSGPPRIDIGNTHIYIYTYSIYIYIHIILYYIYILYKLYIAINLCTQTGNFQAKLTPLEPF